MKTGSVMKRFPTMALASMLCGALVAVAAVRPASAAPAVANATTPNTAATATVPNVTLKRLGSIPIGTSASKLLTDGAGDFAIDDRGRFGFLKWMGADGSDESFMLVDSDGKLVRSVVVARLPGFSNMSGHQHALAWIQGNRWLLTDSQDDATAVPQTTAWWIDAGTGAATRIDGFDSPSIRRVEGTGDGGFVALTDSRSRFGFMGNFLPQQITAYDGNGKQRWMIDDEFPKDPEELYSYFEDIAVTTNHVVVVLEDKGRKLAEYANDGRFVRIVDVPRGTNDKLRHIASDGAGGIVLEGRDIPPSRLTPDGKAIAMSKPVYPGGRPFIPQAIRAAPGGQLWAGDGYGLVRLDANGVATQVLGQAPIDPDQLGPAGLPLVGANGTIYAIDKRTRSVHVFDAEGKHVRVIRPDAWFLDFETDWGSVSDRGDLFLQRRSDDPTTHEFAHFAANQTHARIETIVLKGMDDPSQTLPVQPGSSNRAAIVPNVARDAWWVLLAQPGGTNRWALNHNGLYRVDAAGKVLRLSSLTAQGQKLAFIHQAAAVAPDGSIAIVSEVESHPGDPKAPRSTVVTRFSKSGDPVVTWPVPDGMIGRYGSMDTDGARIAFLQKSFEVPSASGKQAVASVVVTDLHGKPLLRFVPPSDANKPDHNPVVIHLVRHGDARELWLSYSNGTIDRYAMP
jgi:hypothetical protein